MGLRWRIPLMSKYLLVEEVQRDRFARAATLKIGGKTLNTPNFCSLIKSSSPNETEILMEACINHDARFLGSYVVRLADAENVLDPLLFRLGQRGLYEDLAQMPVHKFMDNSILIIDPALEYMYYAPDLQKLSTRRMPAAFVAYVRECMHRHEALGSGTEYTSWKQAHHNQFWSNLGGDAKLKMNVLSSIRDAELSLKADVLIPPVPLVTSSRMLNLTFEINEAFKAISKTRAAECATYILLQSSALSDPDFVERIIDYMKDDQKTKLTVLKIKYLDVTKTGTMSQRATFKRLLRELSLIKEEQKDRAFMLLEAGYQTFPSAMVGFDIVSTSMVGSDTDARGNTHIPYGRWYDPEKLVPRPFEEVKEIFNNNGHALPCYCSICRQLKDLDTVSSDTWNRMRRAHYLHSMNNMMAEIERAIHDKNVELSIDKLANSELKVLTELIPRY